MEEKKIKVSKGTVIKEIEAKQEKAYQKNGWTIIKERPNVFNNVSSYLKK